MRTELGAAPPPRKNVRAPRPAAGGRVPGKGSEPPEPPLPANSPWRIDARSFPHSGSSADQIRFCLRYAALAPSSHNTQPWRFRRRGSRVDILADRTRALPVCDPKDRELSISVGCATHHLEVALARFGLAATVSVLPEPLDLDVHASVKVTARAMPDPAAERLCAAILERRTVRQAFKDEPVPAAVQRDLEAAARVGGVTLHVVSDAEERFKLAKLVAEADVVQFCNRGFRRELAMWLHHNRSAAADGIPGYAMGMSELQSLAAPLVVRTFDVGGSRAARDEELALHSPVLAVLASERDTPTDWINAGRALSAVLLTAVKNGLAASYLNQPVEIPETRLRLKHLTGNSGWPQIVLRLGYVTGPKPAHTPRRSLDQLLVSEPKEPRRKPARSKR